MYFIYMLFISEINQYFLTSNTFLFPKNECHSLCTNSNTVLLAVKWSYSPSIQCYSQKNGIPVKNSATRMNIQCYSRKTVKLTITFNLILSKILQNSNVQIFIKYSGFSFFLSFYFIFLKIIYENIFLLLISLRLINIHTQVHQPIRFLKNFPQVSHILFGKEPLLRKNT